MTGNWEAATAIVIVLLLAAVVVSIAILLRLQRIVVNREQALEDQVNAIDDAVRMVEARLAELHPSWNSSHAGESESEAAAAMGDAPAEGVLQSALEPELQAVIVAAAVAAIGPGAHVRSARLTNSRDNASAWSQQGRVLVQTSHNLRQ